MTNPADTTPLEHARADIAGIAGGLLAHAEVVRIYAEIGNDAGLLYAARCTAAYLDALRGGIAELDRCHAFARFQRTRDRIGPCAGLTEGEG